MSNFWKKATQAGAFGALGMFGGNKNPQHEANKYLNQIPGQSHQTYDPYIQQGQQAGQNLGQQYGKMAQDPAAFYEQLMANYQPSKQYDMQNQEQQRAAGNSAAAGGMRGTQQDVNQAAQISDRLMGEDMQRWYGNVSGLQNTGLAGQQGMYNTGYDASKGLGGDLNNALGQQGGMAFQGAQDANRARGDQMKMLIQMMGAVGGAPTSGFMK